MATGCGHGSMLVRLSRVAWSVGAVRGTCRASGGLVGVTVGGLVAGVFGRLLLASKLTSGLVYAMQLAWLRARGRRQASCSLHKELVHCSSWSQKQSRLGRMTCCWRCNLREKMGQR